MTQNKRKSQIPEPIYTATKACSNRHRTIGKPSPNPPIARPQRIRFFESLSNHSAEALHVWKPFTVNPL